MKRLLVVYRDLVCMDLDQWGTPSNLLSVPLRRLKRSSILLRAHVHISIDPVPTRQPALLLESTCQTNRRVPMIPSYPQVARHTNVHHPGVAYVIQARGAMAGSLQLPRDRERDSESSRGKTTRSPIRLQWLESWTKTMRVFLVAFTPDRHQLLPWPVITGSP
jgi:hypothetical protein